MKVLIVEDSSEVVEVVQLCFDLRWPGTEVVSTASGDKGAALVETESPDVVILDLGLPDMSGFDVLKEIRSFSDVPVLILTVRDDEVSRIKGLEFGADDYIVKPFSPANLLTRVRAVLRRTGIRYPEEEALPQLVAGDVTINFSTREVYRGKERLRLTPTEYKVLFSLARNGGRIVAQETIKQHVWGSEARYVDGSTLKRYIYQLRNKLGDSADCPQIIFNERCVGYRFVKPD